MPAQIVRRQLGLAAGVVHPALELAEGDLADHRVDHVLDLGRQQHAAPHRIGLRVEQGPEGELLAEHRGGLGQGQRRARHQRPLRGGQHLVHAVAQLVRQGHHVPAAALVVHQHVGVGAGHGRDGRRRRCPCPAGPRHRSRALRRTGRRCRPASARRCGRRRAPRPWHRPRAGACRCPRAAARCGPSTPACSSPIQRAFSA